MEPSQGSPYFPFSSFHSAVTQLQVCRKSGCLSQGSQPEGFT